MKLQSKHFTCGPASVANALSCFGVSITEAEIAKLSDTDARDGTDDKGLIKAIEALGYDYSILTDPVKIRKSLTEGNPVVVITEKNEHWVAVVGKLGRKFVVVDPDGAKLDRREIAVRIVTKSALKNNRTWFGISIRKVKK